MFRIAPLLICFLVVAFAVELPTKRWLNLAAIKTKQQATWASGDFAVVGTTLQIVGETLCEALDLRPGQRVLDVAAGNGNATLAAALHHGHRWIAHLGDHGAAGGPRGLAHRRAGA